MDEIIGQYLCEQSIIREKLTSYLVTPAIFNKNAPDDKDEGWEGESQFPRIVYELNMQADPERKVSGQLYIDIMCQNTIDTVPVEELESLVKDVVDGCFFSTSDLTISAQWKDSNAFEQDDDKVEGTTMVFDVLAYPDQLTESPDPIAATNLWVKTLYQSAIVIGRDALQPTWKATDESPAIYCSLNRITDSAKMKSTANVDWFDAEIHINVMSPTENVRSSICKKIIQLLRAASRIILDDGSPMLINKVTSNMAADPLRAGQIVINATYGVLPYQAPQTKLQRTTLFGMCAETEVKNVTDTEGQ